jgi:hypothetical protein
LKVPSTFTRILCNRTPTDAATIYKQVEEENNQVEEEHYQVEALKRVEEEHYQVEAFKKVEEENS